MPRYFIGKLVRDTFKNQEGVEAITTLLDETFMQTALKQKLVEEATEANETKTKEDLSSEIGDVLDVIDALIEKSDLNRDDIEQKRREKASKKGGFNHHTYAHSATIDHDHPLYEVYEQGDYPRLLEISEDFYLGEAHKGDKNIDLLLQSRLRGFNEENGGKVDDRFTFFIYHDKKIVGGISGQINQGVMLIYTMIVNEDYRKHNLGTLLLNRAENHAKEKGCTKAVVDTFDFQAPQFYEKNGYVLDAKVNGWWGKYDRHYFSKNL